MSTDSSSSDASSDLDSDSDESSSDSSDSASSDSPMGADDLKIENALASIASRHLRPECIEDALASFAAWLADNHDDDSLNEMGADKALDLAHQWMARHAAGDPSRAATAPKLTTPQLKKKYGVNW